MLTRARRRPSISPLYEAERSQFQSANEKMRWFGVVSSSLSSFAASNLQKRSPRDTVQDLN